MCSLPNYWEFWQHINYKPRSRPADFFLFCFFLRTKNCNLLFYLPSSICTLVTTPNYEICPGTSTYSQAEEPDGPKD